MIAVVIPSIPGARKKELAEFIKAWEPLFKKHSAEFVIAWDGDMPVVEHNGTRIRADKLMGKKYLKTIFNRNSCVRNLGFAYVAKYLPEVEYIITLDDDTRPIGDTIEDHISTLSRRVPTSWISTANVFMRGFPFNVRRESEVVLSHGVWEGVKDWDAPTQLLIDNIRMPVDFYVGPIPKGIYFPFCGMNVGFKRKIMDLVYWAPQGPRAMDSRFDDIFAGVHIKRELDKRGLAVFTGGAKVLHDRASNVWKNLQREALGLELNEGYWKGEEKDPYFKLYRDSRNLWKEFICGLQ